MTLSVDKIHPGDVLHYYFDTGVMGPKLCYVRVLKVGKKMIKVRDEDGNEDWKYPWCFSGKTSEMDVRELIDEGSLKI